MTIKNKIKKDAKKIFNHLKLIHHESFKIYTFGNGGSCSIAEHMAVDWTKSSNGTYKLISLCSNSAMLTMLANDYGYEFTVSKQIEWLTYSFNTIILISSSGNSPNIVKGAKEAKKRGNTVIGFTGFDGGKLKELSDINIHINSKDYGVCEDYHSNVMHEVSRLIKGDK